MFSMRFFFSFTTFLFVFLAHHFRIEILSPMHKNSNQAVQTNDDNSSLSLQALHIRSIKNKRNCFCNLDNRKCLMNKMSSRKHLNFVFSRVSLRFKDNCKTSF